MPNRLDADRKRRQRAEVDTGLARAVKIRAARPHESVVPCNFGVLVVLVRRMAAGNHFDGIAAKLLECIEQLAKFQQGKLISTRMCNHRHTTGADNPAYRLAQ